MTIDISKLEQLKQLAMNTDIDNLITVLCDIFTEVSDVTTALTGELVTEIQLSQPSGTNSIKVTFVKEDETTVESNTVTITQPA